MANNWNPAFSIRDSSLMDSPPFTRLVFLMLLHAKDREGFVEMGRSAGCLARFCNIDPEHAEEAIHILTSPDPDSKDSTNQGRRIEFVDGRGWLVLNSDKYNERARGTRKQEHAREYMRRKRAAQRQDVVPGCTGLYGVTHVNANVNVNTEGTPESTMPSLAENPVPATPKAEPEAPDAADVTAAFEAYRTAIQPRARLLPAARDKIRRRLNTYSLEELLQAVANFAADAWYMQHNAHRGAAWFYHSDERIEQFANLVPRAQTDTDTRKDTDDNGRNGRHKPEPAAGARVSAFAGLSRRLD